MWKRERYVDHDLDKLRIVYLYCSQIYNLPAEMNSQECE